MEYANGGDLEHYLKSRRGSLLSEDRVLHFFVQISLAIKHIHDRKILHRDLKSQNIFLTNGDMVKLGDFGIARVLRNTAELASTQIGTPYYMSPEIMDNKKYNSKTDIWSLAVILYEIMCLKLPFGGSNIRMLMINIMKTEPPPPPSSYSQGLRDLLKAMLQKTPKARPGITSILSNPVVRSQIAHILDEAHMHREFSHTVLHGEDILRDQQKPVSEARPVINVKDAYKQVVPPQNIQAVQVPMPEVIKIAPKVPIAAPSRIKNQEVKAAPVVAQKAQPVHPIPRKEAPKAKPSARNVPAPSAEVRRAVDRARERNVASVAEKLRAAEENRLKAQNEKLQKLKEQREALQRRNAALQAKPRTPINKVNVAATPVKSSVEKKMEELRRQRLVEDQVRAEAIRERVQRRQWDAAADNNPVRLPASNRASVASEDNGNAPANRYRDCDSSSSEDAAPPKQPAHLTPSGASPAVAKGVSDGKCAGPKPANPDFFSKLESQLGDIKAQMHQLQASPRPRAAAESCLSDASSSDEGSELSDHDAVAPLKDAKAPSQKKAAIKTQDNKSKALSKDSSGPTKAKDPLKRDSQGMALT